MGALRRSSAQLLAMDKSELIKSVRTANDPRASESAKAEAAKQLRDTQIKFTERGGLESRLGRGGNAR